MSRLCRPGLVIAALAALFLLAMEGRKREPRLIRWMVAIGVPTFLHLLLEIQEYWTDVFFGTHNVEGLEDTEGDILMGACGAVMGVALLELALNGPAREEVTEEARRLAAAWQGIMGNRHGDLSTDFKVRKGSVGP